MRVAGLLCALFSLIGCAVPVAINDDYAARQGWPRCLVKGKDFTHVVYTAAAGEGAVWHVYIEGDGEPWQSRTSVARDPTQARPLMLRLMRQDAAPRLYLGRPCYLGMAPEPVCRPWVWTHGRYSEPVVSSMQRALERLIEQHAIGELALFGHSGGATLAMLLAERIPQVGMVVTLAGNLDTAAWTRKHGYSALTGSLNPAERPELPDRIRQFHFRGSEDRNLPNAQLPGDSSVSRHIRLEGVGHTTGWEPLYCHILTLTGGVCKPVSALP